MRSRWQDATFPGMSTQYWLKALGSAGAPLLDDWMKSRPVLVAHATFATRPSRMRKGDKILYYAAGWKVVFAAGTVVTVPYTDPQDAGGYDWRVGVLLEAYKERLHDGIPLGTLNRPTSRNDVRNRIKRRSHVQVSKDEWDAALAAFPGDLSQVA